MKYAGFLASLLIGSFFFTTIEGHAFMYHPTQRSRDGTVWTCGTNPRNGVGWFQNGDITGPDCGICGDDLRDPSPRTNEYNGANYGWGLSQVYRQGQVFTSVVNVPNPHGGAKGDLGIQYRLCTDPQNISRTCFNKVLKIQSAVTLNAEFQYYINQTTPTNLKIIYGTRPKNQDLWIRFRLSLPADTVCDQCVLQMGYLGGQGGGSGVLFRSCADVAIKSTKTKVQMLKNVGAGNCLSLNTNTSSTILELNTCSKTSVGQSIFNFQDWNLYAKKASPIAFEATNFCLNVHGNSVHSGASVIPFQCQRARAKYNELWTSIPSATNSVTFQLVAQAGNPKSPTPGNCLTASPIAKSKPPAWKIIQIKCDSGKLNQFWTVVN